MPIEIVDALSVLSFQHGMPIRVSPDGECVAYTLADPRRKQSVQEQRYGFFTRSGVPIMKVGCDIYVSAVTSSETRNLTEGIGSNWSPCWSPDGKYLAFYSDRDGAARLWVWDREADRLFEIQNELVRIYYPDDTPKWTPDNRLVCRVLPEGMTLEESTDLMVGPRSESKQQDDAKASVRLYSSEEATAPAETQNADIRNLNLSDLVWIDILSGKANRILRRKWMIGCWVSPSGDLVATVSLSKEGMSTVVASIPDQQKRFEHPTTSDRKMPLSWSPDGSKLAYVAKGTCTILSADDGSVLTQTDGERAWLSDPYVPPLWDAEGRHLYVARQVVWQISAIDGTSRPVGQLDAKRAISVLSAGEGKVWASENDQTVVALAYDEATSCDMFCRIEPKTGETRCLLETKGSIPGPAPTSTDVCASTGMVAFIRQSAAEVPDVWIAERGFVSPRRLTHTNPGLDQTEAGQGMTVEWMTDDGEMRRGSLLLPAGYSKRRSYPLIVLVYGGDLGSTKISTYGLGGWGGFRVLQLLASRGYAVFYPDMPLRTGTPAEDLTRSVVSGIRRIVDLGIAAEGRVGLLGHSYGGHGVLSLIVRDPSFAAAVVSAGASNLVSGYGHMRPDGSTYGQAWAETGQGRMDGTPWSERDRYIENSPVFDLNKVETPTFLIAGALDDAVPCSQAEEAFVGLRRLGKKAVYAKYEGESHAPVYWRFANQVDLVERVIAWFDEHMK